jgi:hypothetical protein
MVLNGARGPGRLVVRAGERSLTPYAGLAVSGELARRLGLAELIDAELAVERRARPVKLRRRGLSAGELVVSLAECQLVGGAFFDHVEDVSAPTALALGCGRSPARRRRRRCCRTPSAFGAVTCSVSSARRRGRGSALTARSGATRATR